MTPILRKILFQFRTDNPLRLRIRWNKIECFISIGFIVDRAKWDGARCKAHTFHGTRRVPALTINKAIEDTIDKVNETFFKFEMENIIPTKEEFKERFYNSGKYSNSIYAETAWLEFQREGSSLKQWSENTLKSIRQVQNLFELINPKIKLSEINREVLNNFVQFQQSDKLFNHKKYKTHNQGKHKQPGYANNVIFKNCSILKRFLN